MLEENSHYTLSAVTTCNFTIAVWSGKPLCLPSEYLVDGWRQSWVVKRYTSCTIATDQLKPPLAHGDFQVVVLFSTRSWPFPNHGCSVGPRSGELKILSESTNSGHCQPQCQHWRAISWQTATHGPGARHYVRCHQLTYEFCHDTCLAASANLFDLCSKLIVEILFVLFSEEPTTTHKKIVSLLPGAILLTNRIVFVVESTCSHWS